MSVSYITDLLEGNNFKTLSKNDFVTRLKNKRPTYENTGLENNICKMYFDIDIYTDKINLITANGIKNCCINMVETKLKKLNKNPRICSATSHGMTVERKLKYSVRLYVPNIKISKKNNEAFVIELNKNVDEELWDYIPETEELFDTSVYDKNRKMRCIGTSKPNEDRPLICDDDCTIEDTIITDFFDDDCELLEMSQPETQSRNNNNNIKLQTPTDVKESVMQLFLENNVFRSIAFGKRVKWIKLGMALKNEFGNNGRQYFHFISKLDESKYDSIEVDTQFDSFNTGGDKKVTWGTIMHFVKEESEELFNKAVKMMKTYNITKNDVLNPFLCSGIISKTLKDTLILCNENWIVCNRQNLWERVKEPLGYIIEEIYKYLDFEKNKINSRMNIAEGENKMEIKKELEEWLRIYNEVTKGSYTSQLIKSLKRDIVDNTFERKLDSNNGELAFKNGIIDLKTKEFRSGIKSSDFITATIPYDYVESDFEYLKSVLLKILNNNPEHLEYCLSVYGYSFTGETNQKSLFFMIDKSMTGGGNNGKSLFFEILNNIFPNYVYKSKNTFILDGNSKLHKQMTMTKGKRLVWLEELPKNQFLNASFIKELADGKTTENEVMYGTSEIIDIMFNVFVLSNHLPKISDSEDAVYNRYKQISFHSNFDDRDEENIEKLQFKKDVTLCNTIIDNHYNEVINLIVHYAHQFYNKGLPKIPEEFQNDIKETKTSNDKFEMWFNEYCNIVEDGKVALKAMVESSTLKEDKIKEAMKKRGFIYKKDLSGMGKDMQGKHYKGGYQGIELIENNNDNIEEIDED